MSRIVTSTPTTGGSSTPGSEHASGPPPSGPDPPSDGTRVDRSRAACETRPVTDPRALLGLTMAALLSAALVAACGGPPSAEKPPSPDPPTPAPSPSAAPSARPRSASRPEAKTCSDAPGFRYERIELPPEF